MFFKVNWPNLKPYTFVSRKKKVAPPNFAKKSILYFKTYLKSVSQELCDMLESVFCMFSIIEGFGFASAIRSFANLRVLKAIFKRK